MARSALHKYVNSLWYGESRLAFLLSPLSAIFYVLSSIRKHNQHSSQIHFDATVIIVGNITVGGTGKTPMVIALVTELLNRDYKVGVASRGYQGTIKKPTLLHNSHTPAEVGDEPLLIFQNTQAAVMVGSNRVMVIQSLIKDYQCDVIICDDGMQDYRFKHDVEIVMVDGDRVFGNQMLLPAGPLREPIKRLQKANLIISTNKVIPAISSDCMKLHIETAVNIHNHAITKDLAEWGNETVHVVAGIGNPERFFNALKALGLNVIEHSYPDHVSLTQKDVTFPDQLSVLMTEKDAVKCRHYDLKNTWYIPLKAEIPNEFLGRVIKLINK
jgi:tetraacyldisaccharide 4'-kinase